jgi:hypothetical protein
MQCAGVGEWTGKVFYEEINNCLLLFWNWTPYLSIRMQESLCCVPCETCKGLGNIEVMLLGFVFANCYWSNWSAVIEWYSLLCLMETCVSQKTLPSCGSRSIRGADYSEYVHCTSSISASHGKWILQDWIAWYIIREWMKCTFNARFYLNISELLCVSTLLGCVLQMKWSVMFQHWCEQGSVLYGLSSV